MGQVEVMKNFNMSVEQGTIYSMIGKSGCGKTTLFACLVGLQKFDSGEVKIFDQPLNNPQSFHIGFMPQEIALFGDFKFKEIVWFFGTVFNLSAAQIEEKVQHLSSLLDLADENKLIKDCSGGQQRRISLAVSLVHDPSLLILDEPTVGIDCLLREKIWNYLVELTQTKNVTILLSTHYIGDAIQSDRVGFLRNGVLVAEDSPQNIMEMCEASDMEESFLKLSKKQEHSRGNFKVEPKEMNEEKQLKISKSTFKEQQVQITSRIIFALLSKHSCVFARNSGILAVILLMPIVGNLSLYFGIGQRLSGLVLGVVNEEASFCADRNFTTDWVGCKLNKLSCRYIEDFDQNTAKLKFYETFEEAFREAREAKIIGILHFSRNFTENLAIFNDDHFGAVNVFLDQTDLQKTTLIQNEIIVTFQKFTKRIMRDCGKSEKLYSSPLKIEPVYGPMNFEMKKSFGIGFFLLSICTFSSAPILNSLINERASCFWDRCLVAGISPRHFLISHLLSSFIVMLVQVFEYGLYALFFLLDTITLNAASLLLLFLFVTGFFGLVFGAFLAGALDSAMTAMNLCSGFAFYTFYMSGVVWPIQGMPEIMQYFANIFSYAVPINGLRNIVYKNSTFFDFNVLMGFLLLMMWTVILLVCSFILIEKKKKPRNAETR